MRQAGVGSATSVSATQGKVDPVCGSGCSRIMALTLRLPSVLSSPERAGAYFDCSLDSFPGILPSTPASRTRYLQYGATSFTLSRVSRKLKMDELDAGPST